MEAKRSPTRSTRRSPRNVKSLLWLVTAVIAALALLVAGTNSGRARWDNRRRAPRQFS